MGTYRGCKETNLNLEPSGLVLSDAPPPSDIYCVYWEAAVPVLVVVLEPFILRAKLYNYN